jgi:hypothetical protein
MRSGSLEKGLGFLQIATSLSTKEKAKRVQQKKQGPFSKAILQEQRRIHVRANFSLTRNGESSCVTYRYAHDYF